MSDKSDIGHIDKDIHCRVRRPDRIVHNDSEGIIAMNNSVTVKAPESKEREKVPIDV